MALSIQNLDSRPRIDVSRRIEEFLSKYEAYFYGVAKNLSKTRDDREDLVQSARLKVTVLFTSDPAAQDAYVKRACINEMYTILRGRRRYDKRFVSSGSHEAFVETLLAESPEELIAGRIATETVIASLAPELRSVLTLCVGEGLSYAEAEEATGVPAKTLKSRNARALRMAKTAAEALEQNMSYADRVPVPTPESINSGLSSPSNDFLIGKLGKPRKKLTTECQDVTEPKLKKMIVREDVGPFVVRGHKVAVESLKRIFAKVKEEKPDLYEVVGTAGMLCCRYMRGSKKISNHSFGMAIDLTIEGKLDGVGDGKCQRGLLELYRYFHAEGWYWGAEFKGPREDAMHFELAKETIARLI